MASLDLIDRLQRFERPSGPRGDVLDFLELSFSEVPFLSADDIAKRSGVSKATVVRAVQHLGYRGLKDLRAEVRTALYPRYDSPLERVRRREAPPISGIEGLVDTCRDVEVDNIRATFEMVDIESVGGLCARLVEAHRVWVYGMRFSYGLAFNLGLLLSQLLPDVQVVAGEGGTTADRFSMATPNDYAVVVGHARIGAEKVALMRYLKRREIRFSLITDLVHDEVVADAEFLFVCVTRTLTTFSSYASSYALIQFIATMLEAFMPTSVERLSESEIALKRLNAFHFRKGED